MRDLILKRLEALRIKSDNFSKANWENITSSLLSSHPLYKVHISDVDFTTMSDYDLLVLFERIIRKFARASRIM